MIHQGLESLMFGAWDGVMTNGAPLNHNVGPYLHKIGPIRSV
jgi:hypothetical protein